MTRKIMFFDIDGTLLSEKTGTIPQSTIEGFKKAKEKGHLLFINTGRPFSTINQSIKDLNPDGYVCGCGTYIQYHGKELFSTTLSASRCNEIIDALHKYNIDAVLEGKETTYFDTTIRHPFPANMKENYHLHQFNIASFLDTPVIFDKFAIWFDEQSDIEGFKKAIPDFEYIVRGPEFGEIVPLGYSKASGIQFLLDYFNIDIDDCYVFGDSMNDKAMLEYVKHAIVMGNGEPELFQHAFYVTKDIEADGIYHALEHLELI